MVENLIEFRGVSKSFGDHHILSDINLTIKRGEFLTLLGPSGCGKTTLLRLISGFEEPDKGSILLNNQDLKGLPPHLRQVHTVFQSYALFPHMKVFDNVAFGLRCQKISKDEILSRTMDALRMVKLQHLAERKPHQLSGGQQQRVAIARALVNRPLGVLLDEPLSSLDYRLRKNMQIELKQLQRKLGIVFVFVTHDQEEALSMSDRIVVMHDGHIQQVGTPREVYEKPKNLTVSQFIGEVNIFDVNVTSRQGKTFTGDIEGHSYTFNDSNGAAQGDKVHVLIRPEDLRVWNQNEVSDTTGMLQGTVEEVIYKGTTVDLMVRLPSQKLLAATEFFDEGDENLEYRLQAKVWINWLPGWEVILPYEEKHI
jgi:spermidine/putrescine transport system ATP-binding protein